MKTVARYTVADISRNYGYWRKMAESEDGDYVCFEDYQTLEERKDVLLAVVLGLVDHIDIEALVAKKCLSKICQRELEQAVLAARTAIARADSDASRCATARIPSDPPSALPTPKIPTLSEVVERETT